MLCPAQPGLPGLAWPVWPSLPPLNEQSLLDLNCSLHQFFNHPKISILINQRDEDIFRYLTNLQVRPKKLYWDWARNLVLGWRGLRGGAMVWWGFHHYPHHEQVQDLRHISMGYKMKLYFQTNPYFTNMVIVKEFQCNRSGKRQSQDKCMGTPTHTYPCPVPSP